MSKETKRVTNPAYDALGPENDVYVDTRFIRKGRVSELSHTMWSYNIRGTSTDTRPTNITEGAD